MTSRSPTASFPSGHTGATLAQLLILLFLLHGLLGGRLARAAVWLLTLAFVGLLGYSRLYLGMHHVSDVAVGLVNGAVCAVLAWNYLSLHPTPDRAVPAAHP